MPLNFIIGPAQSGKKQLLFERFRASLDLNKAPYLLVPSSPEASLIRKELLKKSRAIIGATVMTYNNFLQELAQNTGVTQRLIDPVQQNFIIRQIIEKAPLVSMAGSSKHAGFSNAITLLLNELKEGMTGPDDLDRAFSNWNQTYRSRAYLNDITTVYRAYLDELTQLELLDEQLLRWEIVNALENAESEATRPLFLYGFDDFTTSQRRIIELLSVNAEVTFTLMYENTEAFAGRKAQVEDLLDAAGDNVAWTDSFSSESTVSSTSSLSADLHFLVAAGDRGEVELAGAKIVELLRNGKYQPDEVAVVLRDPGKYGGLITRVFDDFSIPFSFSEPVSFTHTHLGRALMALLSFCFTPPASPPDISKLISYLRVRHQDKQSLIDLFERKVRIEKISDQHRLLDIWREMLGEDTAEIDNLPAANGFLEVIGCIRSIATAVFDALFNNTLHEKNGSRALSRNNSLSLEERVNMTAFIELEKALRSIENLLAVAPHLCPRMGAAANIQLSTILERIEVRVGREAEDGKVHVLRVHRSRGRSYKVVFVLGLNDGSFPNSTSDDPFFNISERIQLSDMGLEIETRQNNIAEERYLFYIASTRASEKLFLSYQSVDNNANELLKSSFIVDLEAELKNANIEVPKARRPLSSVVFNGDIAPIPSAKEALRYAASIVRKDRPLALKIAATVNAANSKNNPSMLDIAIANAPTPKPVFVTETVKNDIANRNTFGISEIESFAKCPFKWYIERILKPQEMDAKLDNLNKGNIIHKTLEEFYRALPTSLGVNYPTKECLTGAEELMLEIFEMVFERDALDKKSIDARFDKHMMAENLKRFVRDELMRMSTLPTGFSPRLFEASFGLNFGTDDKNSGIASIRSSCGGNTDGDDNINKNDCDKKEYLVLADGTKIRGIIDRIDTDSSGRAIVVDYKSNTIPGTKDLESGDSLQIPVYMEAVKRLWGLNPIAGALLSVAKGTSDGIYNGDILDILGGSANEIFLPLKAGRDSETFQRIISDALQKAQDVAAEIRSGGFPASGGDNTCRNCGLHHVCRKGRV